MKNLKTSPLNTQKGFTLIELVVVIVILGILAATAAPKFIDLTGDAKAATVQAVRASVESATTMVHAKALIAGATDGEADLDVNGGTDNVGVTDGWPNNETATWAELLDIELYDATNFPDAPFDAVADGTTGTNGIIVFYSRKSTEHSTTAAAIAENCYVRYPESTSSTTKPAITIVTDGC
jgi:MSHA pilin protein MshA